MNTKNLGLLVIALLAGPVGAETIVVGTPTSDNAIPFGGGSYALDGTEPAPISEYQQVYDSGVFSGSETIKSLTFYCSAAYCGDSANAKSLSTGDYQLFLSTTSASVNGLSTDLFSNTGSNDSLVYSGDVPNATKLGQSDQFTFSLSKSFFYDPTLGNLLLTVTVGNQGPATFGLQADDSGSLTSRAYSTESGNTGADSAGLVTGFGVAPTAAPEVDPASAASGLALLFGSVAVLRGRRRVRA